MRIAFATPEYITEQNYFGGLANYLHRVARELVQQGHEVHIVTYSEANTGFVQNGVHVHRVVAKDLQLWLNRLSRWRLMETAYILSHSWKTFLTLRTLHRTTPLDFIQYANYQLPGLFAASLLPIPYALRGSSLTTAWNSMGQRQDSLDRRLVERLENQHFRRCRHVFVPSQTLKKMLVQNLGLTNVEVIPSPFYIEIEHQDDTIYQLHLTNKRYLLYFGRLQRTKGIEILARALSDVLVACPDMYVTIIGRDMQTAEYGSTREYTKKLAGAYAERLIFIDNLRHEQLYPIIEHAKLVVLPSLVDNMPNACLEAMGLGCPVVGTIGTSLDELIEHEKTGFLVQPADISGLTNTIISCWKRSDLKIIGQQAQQSIVSLQPKYTVEALLDYYARIIA